MARNDDAFVASVLGMGRDTVESSRMDAGTHALVRLAALLSVGAPADACRSSVQLALEAGAGFDAIVGILIAIAPVVGLARVVSAAPQLADALGYDVEAALERAEPRPPRGPAP